MIVEGVDVAEDEMMKWEGVDEIIYQENGKYYTLFFEDGKSEVFGGYIEYISQ